MIERLSKEREKLDDILRGYDPVKKLQEERDALLAVCKQIDAEAAELKIARTAFIRKYEVLLTLYPRIKQTMRIIQEKELAGDLPPAIDKDLLNKLLTHPSQRCPICDSSIDEHALEHIQALFQQFSVSSHTSNYLKEIKGSLEVVLDEVAEFKSRRDEIKQREIDIADRKKVAENRLGEIAAALSNFESSSGQIDVAKIESKRADIINQINNANQAIGVSIATIQTCEKKLKDIEAKRSVALKKLGEHNEIRKQIAVIEMLHSHFKRIKGNRQTNPRAKTCRSQIFTDCGE